MKNKQIYIAIVGMSSSGKDTVADYFYRRGFYHISLSDLVRDACRKKGISQNRDNLIRIGNELRQRYGPGYFGKKAIAKMIKKKYTKVIFSSIRNPYEIYELKKRAQVFVIAVIASLPVRYQRIKKRNRFDDQVTLAKFKAQEQSEKKGVRHQQQLDRVIQMADYKINNNSTLPALNKEINKVLSMIKHESVKSIMNIIVLGPQGSGKGTQAKMLEKRFKLAYIGTGDIFRRIARQKTTLGRKIKHLYDQGNLVPSDFVIKLVNLEIGRVKLGQGLVFDGHPRNLKQARALDKVFAKLGRQITHVFYLPISKRTTIKRLSLRRTCRKCRRLFIYGVDLKKNRKACPSCGGEIFQREDDKPAAIARRLAVYNKSTWPIINYYKKQGVLIKIDGEPSIKQVMRSLLKHLI